MLQYDDGNGGWVQLKTNVKMCYLWCGWVQLKNSCGDVLSMVCVCYFCAWSNTACLSHVLHSYAHTSHTHTHLTHTSHTHTHTHTHLTHTHTHVQISPLFQPHPHLCFHPSSPLKPCTYTPQSPPPLLPPASPRTSQPSPTSPFQPPPAPPALGTATPLLPALLSHSPTAPFHVQPLPQHPHSEHQHRTHSLGPQLQYAPWWRCSQQHGPTRLPATPTPTLAPTPTPTAAGTVAATLVSTCILTSPPGSPL